jgi:antirestriction protein ArdC
MGRPQNTKQPRTYDQLKPKLDVHDAITSKIVAAIEAGAGDFQMPWHRPGVSFALPKNALTENVYRGSNILSLWIDTDEKKFEHQTWATYKQWEELGAQVRKREKGSLIVKYGEWTPKDDGAAPASEPRQRKRSSTPDGTTDQPNDADGGKRLFAKAAFVFNVAQVDGYTIAQAKPRSDLTERLAHVDAFIAATGAEFREGGQRAFYRHRGLNGDGDFIQVPERNLFTGTTTSSPTETYESTRLHELTHWTGADHRLNRLFGERFGDNAYAFEELVAELGAAYLCAGLEITNAPRADHAQYLANWLEVLKGDTKAIFTAASMATRAVDFLYGLQPGSAPTPAPIAASDPTRPDDERNQSRDAGALRT